MVVGTGAVARGTREAAGGRAQPSAARLREAHIPGTMIASRARTVSVKAQAKQQAKPAKVNLARAAAAVVTSVALLAAPVIAAEVNDDSVRPPVCASNPTAKICLKGSFERSQK